MVKIKDSFLIAFFIFLICATTIMVVAYYYTQEGKCQANPLVYSANYYLDRTTADSVNGHLFLFKGLSTKPLELIFNDKEVKIREG